MTPTDDGLTTAELLRLGWGVMFLIGSFGGALLVWAFGREWIAWRPADGPYETQAASSFSDGILIWIGALLGLGAAVAAAESQGLIALGCLLAFGFIYNVMILNMLRGRRSVTNAIQTYGDRIRRRERAAKKES